MKHRHNAENGLILLAKASVLKYWDEAFLTSIYLINRLSTPILKGLIPIGAFLNISPDTITLASLDAPVTPTLETVINKNFK